MMYLRLRSVDQESENVESAAAGTLKVGAVETSASAGGFSDRLGLIENSLREPG
jgi:hypothetical protein